MIDQLIQFGLNIFCSIVMIWVSCESMPYKDLEEYEDLISRRRRKSR